MAQQFDIIGNLLLKVDGAEAGLNKLKNNLSKLKMPEGLENSFKKSFSNLDGLLSKYKAQLKDGFETKSDISNFIKTGKQIEAEYDKISATVTKLTGKEISFKLDLSNIQQAEKRLEQLIDKKEQLNKNISGGLGLKQMLEAMQASDVGRRGTKVFDASNMLQVSLGRNDLQKAKTDVEGLITELERMSDARKRALETRTNTSLNNIIDTLRNSINNADQSLDNLNQDIKTTSDSMASIKADQMERVNQAIEDAVGDADRLTSGFKELNGGAQQAAESMYSMTHQIEQLKTSTQYFFSLGNMFNLLKRGIGEAVQTIKELDAAMTETAVVTDFNVGDMWSDLPKYTKLANELGATTQGAYETMTLYYQQGLNQNQAFALGAETMKMARIAGLDYAETTDMMTAALRGFNMELDETSAKRVNDVYSKLAAITASDTEELGSAMQRTASIAHSAGMSFEGTTAFLAQAIETTREPAENIGTAMKTIIARFQEMKKNPLEISEVEGEEVDFNKVDAALKTIGVDLKDTNGQFRELDKVFLDISQRWDGLSQTQQRYIATTAAGSRQQSRFIAMMDDYDRTVQLMDAAQNSSGAADAQFAKTADSLEYKLNKLNNAWQQFLMGIMNDSWTKKVVDGVTTVVGKVNELINTLSFGGKSKGIKSFLSLFTAFKGLQAAGKLANMAIGGLGGIIDPKSSMFKGMFSGATGMRQGANAAQAKAISDPIVNVLRQIYAKMNDNQGPQQEGLSRGSWQDFKNAQSKFRENAKTGTIGDTIGSLNGLDKAQINGILANNPAIENRLQRGFNNYLANMDLTPGTKKATSKAIPGIFKAFKQDPNMSPDAFVKALRPDQIGASLIKSGQLEAGKELTRSFAQQRKEAYMKFVGIDPRDEFADIDLKGYVQRGKAEEYKKFVENYKGAEGGALPEPSKWEGVASKVGAVGAVFGTAGQAVTSFGMALSGLGLEKVGNGIAALGTQLSSLGMTVSSLAMTMASVTQAGGLAKVFAPVIPYIPYIIAAAAAIGTIAAVAIKAKKETQAIKDSAEAVTKTFEETSEKTKGNITSLKQYKDEMASLSKGVDSNGNNVSLSTEEYDEYLKIVDEVAAMNPEIVRGYNAQGHAIIDNNTALQKTLDLQEQINKEATEEYLQKSSLEKLLAARNLRSSDYTKNATFVGENISRADQGRAQFMYGDANYGIHKSDIKKQIIPLQKQTQKVAKELQSSELYKQDEKQIKTLLSNYGIDFDQLLDGEKESVDNFVKNQDAIQSQLNTAAEGLDIDFSDKFNNAFDSLKEDTAAFDAAIDPIFKNLAARVSESDAFKDVAPELQTSLMSGLKEIAKQDISASEMIKQSKELTTTFKDLADKSGDYGKVMDDIVTPAQEAFADNLDEEAYNKSIQPAIDKLYELRDAAKEMHTATGDAVAEFYDNQIAQVENFATAGASSLNEALNTMSGQFAEARGAYEEFSNAVKDNDFYTAADNMKKIFDEIDNDVDKAGLGSKKFWMGAEELLGAENIDGLDKEAVAKQLDNIKPLLQEGEDGFQAFWDLIDQHKDKLNELDGVKVGEDGWLKEWPDDLSEISQELGISEKLLASLLDKSRQFAHIDLSDPAKVREAVATSDTTITGTQGDKKNLYVKEDSMRASLREADYTTKDEQDKELKRMEEEEQIFTIGNPEDISDEQVSAMQRDLNLGDLPGLIETFGQTGEYTKEEIQGLAERFGVYEDEKGFNEAYDEWVERSLDPIQSKQTDLLSQLNSNVASIAASVVSKRIKEGHLDKSKIEEGEYATYGKSGVADTLGQLFSKGKDGNGNYFQSDAAFERNKKAVEDQKNSYQEYIDTLKEGQKHASETEKEKFQQEIDAYEKMVGYLDQWIKDGEEAYQKHKQEEEGSNDKKAEAPQPKEETKPKETKPKEETRTKEETKPKSRDLTWEDKVPGWLANLIKRSEKSDLTTDPTEKEYANKSKEMNMQAQEGLGKLLSWIGGQLKTEWTTDYGAEGREQKISGGVSEPLDLGVGTPSADPKEAARQAAQEKFTSWIQGLIEGSNSVAEDPKTAAAQKAKEDYQSYIDGIREAAVDQKMTGGIDSDIQTQTREKLSKMWESIKQAFTSGFGGTGVETGTTAGVGAFSLDAKAKILEVVPPTEKPEIPVKAKLEVEGNTSGGLLSKFFGGKNQGPTIDVVANVASIKAGEQQQTLDVIGNVTKLNSNSTVNNVDATATVTQVVKSGRVSGEPISVKAVATTTKVKNETPEPKESTKTQIIKVSADTSLAQAKINQLISTFNKVYTLRYTASGPTSISVPISANFTGPWEKTVKINKSGAKGINNYIGHYSMPSFGSAAKGRYGRVGPKGKGGLTLTGEEGFEIAWLPNESKSMIVGANGPQMIDLPPDAVVYTHEQSKKIIKQKSIPAGSHRGTSDSPVVTRAGGGGGGGGGGGTGTRNNNNNGVINQIKENADDAATIIQKAGKVSVWWENMTRRIETTQRNVDKNQKKFETLLKTFGKTAQTATSVANDYKKSLKKSITLNQAEVKKANQELKSLDKKGKTSISYDIKKNGKKTTKKTSVNLGDYIKEYDGTYIIDQKALNKVANKNKSKAEAIKSAAEQKLNDKLGKKNKAEDEIAKAQEALDKIADDIYTTFYQWENSLNKVYFLSKRLSDLSNQMNVRESQSSLLSAKALAGFGSDISALSQVLTQEKDLMIEQVTANQQNLEASKKAYDDSLKLSTYVKRYQKAPDSKEAQADFKAAQWALKFLESGGKFDESKIAELESKGYSADTIERIKKVIEDIDQKRSDAMNAAAESNNAVAAIYSKITEYQDYISDFESELLSGLEEQTEKEINKLDKINSSLTKAYKELLDEVKRALDERRRKEDNAKTESDISKKQQRLALLQADTSGGHATEIAQLEKEISEAQQNYQRSLEDQLIEKLQNQGDKAEKQRQKQIDLLNIQKDIAKKTGSNLADVQKWLNDWQQTGDKQAYENIRNAWLANHNYDEATDNEKIALERQFDEAWMKYGAYSLKIPELQKEAEKLDENTAAIQNLTEAIIGNAKPSYGWKAFKDAGGSAKQARELGATAEKLKKAGYSEKSIFNAGYSKSELSKAGFNAASLTKAGITAKQLRSRGYGFKEVQKAGKYSGAQMAKAGYTAAEFKKAGYSAKQTAKYFKDAGFSAQQISDKIAQGYGKNALTTTNMVTGKSVQTQTGASAASIQKTINKSKNDKATQSDLAGVTAKMDINGKKKGGKKTGTISESGKQIAVNKGSTLYVQKWDTKTGKPTGKAKSYTIDKLTANLLKKHPKEAKDALIYAIQHKKPGELINKKMKDLISQAGLKGKTYKLQNGTTASIGSEAIHYNGTKKKKDGVYVWNPATGKLSFREYNKNKFIKWAKDKNTGREYKYVLKKKKVKGYATGGLADYTGPAWLDGTPSKPELVLNAQDTKNFIALKDVLSKAIGSTGAVENTYGNATYEININVDHLNNDYDVDKVVERVKKKIVQDSSYRNVTQVRKFR